MSAADNMKCDICGNNHHPMTECRDALRSLASAAGSPRSVNACPDEDFNESAKTEIARLQLTDHLAGREIACAKCRLVRPMHAYYRCRWCGVWYCLTCAGVHFGPDAKHSPENSPLTQGLTP